MTIPTFRPGQPCACPRLLLRSHGVRDGFYLAAMVLSHPSTKEPSLKGGSWRRSAGIALGAPTAAAQVVDEIAGKGVQYPVELEATDQIRRQRVHSVHGAMQCTHDSRRSPSTGEPHR